MVAVIVTMILAIGQASLAEDLSQTEVDKVQLQRWQKYYSDVASQYKMAGGAELDTELKLHSKAVLNYFNAISGSQTYGSMFVWTRDGRPEIVGAIWSKRKEDLRRIVHSFHSMSVGPVRAQREESVFWSPKEKGIDPLLIPDAPPPGDTPQQRLAQMRSLARNYAASTIRDTIERQLRLLPQPLFRFDEPEVDRDGGLFMWVEEWDPELLMLIETRPTPGGPKWHASFDRFTNLPVTAKFKGRQVWRFASSTMEPAQGGVEHRYMSVHRIEVLPHFRDE